jgi:hypothetical protein
LPREPAPIIRIRGGFADMGGLTGAGRRSTSSTVGESACGAILLALVDSRCSWVGIRAGC